MKTNTIICSPFEEPERHFVFDREKRRTTEKIEPGRRPSFYWELPKQQDRRSERQGDFLDGRTVEHDDINGARLIVGKWRGMGDSYSAYATTRTTQKLLAHWRDAVRYPRLFFCQLEAVETAIYLNEVERQIDRKEPLAKMLRRQQETYHPLFSRTAFKMATGSGKTLVMGMLIAYHFLNRLYAKHDRRFAESFLVVAPNVTIRDRLEVLKPTARGNYYQEHNLVPPEMWADLQRASVVVKNYHAFMEREGGEGTAMARRAAGQRKGALKEGEEQMVERVCDGLRGDILVLNDEAHHCYHPAEQETQGTMLETTQQTTQQTTPQTTQTKGTGDRGKGGKGGEEDEGDEEGIEEHRRAARVWFRGLESVHRVRGLERVYDLSATPFFLRGSGEGEGRIFPWTVSDFSLTEAIESGIVKIPRVPLDDSDENYRYRRLWPSVREGLPVSGRMSAEYRQAVESAGPLSRCQFLEKALLALYGRYEEVFKIWSEDAAFEDRGSVPPVFIVVCQNTEISRLVRDYITGEQEVVREVERKSERKGERGLKAGRKGQKTGRETGQKTGREVVREVVRRSALELLTNDTDEQRTILVDSREMEKGEGLSDTFKREAQAQLARVKGVRSDSVKAGEILREMMNTVGKKGEAGARVRCVVSVSMLTEGWDANNVTHILGVRAFSTQLLCEQVVGRALRRTSYNPQKVYVDVGDGTKVVVDTFAPEYADIFGVPFDAFFPVTSSSGRAPVLTKKTLVQSLSEREHYRIVFPRVEGYRRLFLFSELRAKFTEDSVLDLHASTGSIGTWVSVWVGEGAEEEVTIEKLKQARLSEVAFTLTHNIFRRNFRAPGSRLGSKIGKDVEVLHFPVLLRIVERWMKECVRTREGYPLQYLLLQGNMLKAMEKVYNAIEQEEMDEEQTGEEQMAVQLSLSQPEGSTDGLRFETTLNTCKTEKSHLSHVVSETRDWEQRLALTMEGLKEVLCYVKNDRRMGFEIPYEFQGKAMSYVPDFIVHIDDGDGLTDPFADPLKVIIEVSGPREAERKARKVEVTRKFWCAGVNRLQKYGRWDFLELKNEQLFYTDLRAYLKKVKLNRVKLQETQQETQQQETQQEESFDKVARAMEEAGELDEQEGEKEGEARGAWLEHERRYNDKDKDK